MPYKIHHQQPNYLKIFRTDNKSPLPHIKYDHNHINHCLVLMGIVDDGNMTLNIRLAALLQLKNNIREDGLE